MSEKVKFGSKLGIIAATVGSAVGLGNVWRFPAETQANGGAAFLLIYVACVILFGIPVMTAEFALGRGGESDAAGVFRKITPERKGWWMVGVLAIVASYLILSFYMVVSGWTLEYLWQSLTGALYEGTAGETGAELEGVFAQRMSKNITDGYLPAQMTLLMTLANLFVLKRGINKGIEKMSNVMMPLLFVLLLAFCFVSLSLPKAAEGVEYFLRPDFSAVTPATVINALGQSFFSLSLAMGILVTYAAYYPASTKLTRTAVTVSMLDLLVALMMGFIIFPAVTTFGLQDSNLAGSSLVFLTLPEIFVRMGATQVWSSLFFLLLTVAAFTSTVSLGEVSVSFVMQRFKTSRDRACTYVFIPLMFLSTACALSVGPWSGFTILGMNLFDFLDTVTTNIMLPVGGILLCVYMGWIAPADFFKSQLTNGGKFRSVVFTPVRFIIRWLAPILIAVILISQFV